MPIINLKWNLLKLKIDFFCQSLFFCCQVSPEMLGGLQFLPARPACKYSGEILGLLVYLEK